MAAKKGRRGSGGRPTVRMLRRPHPALQMTLPAGLDAVSHWNAAGMQPLALRLVPENAADRDRHYNNPQAKQTRALGNASV